VSILDSELKCVDQTVSVTHHEISLLREYRTRLIADVVTGKVDVRGLAAELPQEEENAGEYEEETDDMEIEEAMEVEEEG